MEFAVLVRYKEKYQKTGQKDRTIFLLKGTMSRRFHLFF